MEFMTVFLMTCAGGLLRWLLGWAKSGQRFVVRKFATTMAITILAAVGLAVLYDFQDMLTVPGVLSAFLAGYSVDKVVCDLWDNLANRTGGKQ